VTYVQFLLAFLAPPILGLLGYLGWRRRLSRRIMLAIALTIGISLVYTGPWDHAIIAQGVWSYDPARVFGITIGLVPLEEYGFVILQVILVGLITGHMMSFRER
jgi:lycopene beta-cyclase